MSLGDSTEALSEQLGVARRIDVTNGEPHRDPSPEVSMSQQIVNAASKAILSQFSAKDRRRGGNASAGAVIGATVGSFLGGPVGAAIGGAVGSAAGVALGEMAGGR